MAEPTEKERFYEWLKAEKRLDPTDYERYFREVAKAQIFAEFQRATAAQNQPAPAYQPPAKASLPEAYTRLSASDQLRFLNAHQAHASGHMSPNDFAALSRKLGMTTESAS